MANLKVSEMTEATTFDDNDYTMIIQANQSKKISKENMLGGIETDIESIETDIENIETSIGNLTELETADKTNLVDSINSLMPVELYSNDEGTFNNITLNDDISNYSYYEIIYARENEGYSSIKMPTDYITGVCFMNSIYLNNILRIYSANITISGTTLTRNYDTYLNFTGENQLNFGRVLSLYIYKVIGYK